MPREDGVPSMSPKKPTRKPLVSFPSLFPRKHQSQFSVFLGGRQRAGFSREAGHVSFLICMENSTSHGSHGVPVSQSHTQVRTQTNPPTPAP